MARWAEVPVVCQIVRVPADGIEATQYEVVLILQSIHHLSNHGVGAQTQHTCDIEKPPSIARLTPTVHAADPVEGTWSVCTGDTMPVAP